jgi:NitT/TauT family transport system substrate-binding protein
MKTVLYGTHTEAPEAIERALALRLVLGILLSAPTLLGLSERAALAQIPTINVGLASTSSDIGFFIADKRGYFREVGLSINMTNFGSAAQMIAPLSAGQLDVGGGTVAAGLYNAVGEGIALKIVADKASIRPHYDFSTLLVRKDLIDSGAYRDFKDLKGMTVAVAAPGSGSESAMNEALKRDGLTIKDVRVTYLGYPDHLIAYHNKAIDASITAEPTVTRAIKENVAARVMPGDEVVYPNQQTAVVLFSDSFIARRDEAERFMMAYLRAVRDYVSTLRDGKIAGPGAEEMIAILTQYTGIKDPAIYREMTSHWVDPDGHVSRPALENDLEFFREQGYVRADNKVGVDQVIDESFAAAAVKKLGSYKPQAAQ